MSSPLDAESESLTEEGFHWQQAFSPVAWSLLLNIEREPFDDVRVRRAVSMAIDRHGIAETILSGLNPVAYQQFQEGYLGHDPALDVDPYDPDAARALIEEAGATGATVQVIQNQTPPGNSLAQVIQQELGDIGLSVELVPLGASEATPAWREGTYAASVGNNAGQAEPSLSLKIGYLGAGYPADPPAELVQMADAALAVPVDSPEQEAAYQAISAYLVENPILVPIAQFTTVHLCRPNVVGCDTLPELGQLDFRRVAIAAG
jgi:ABC-type transport system substrate-binding protein